jgi:hypothetical protein
VVVVVAAVLDGSLILTAQPQVVVAVVQEIVVVDM